MIQMRTIKKPKTFFLDGGLKFAQDIPPSLSEIFHENSKLFPHDMRNWMHQQKNLDQKYMKPRVFMERSAKSYKTYPSLPQITLPPPNAAKSVDLWETIRKRRSLREYTHEPIQLEQVSTILSHGYGENHKIHFKNYSLNLRATPSIGALYPLEIYLVACNFEDLENGLYHYNVHDHSLEDLKQGSFLEKLIPLLQQKNNQWLMQAGAIFFVTGVFRRARIKYGERGYRGVLLDAGHLSQNLQVGATGLDLASCVLMGCLDDPINDFLEIDGVEESILYAISLAHPQS